MILTDREKKNMFSRFIYYQQMNLWCRTC